MSEWIPTPLGELVDILDSKRVPLSAAQRSSRKGPYPYYGAQGVIDHIDDFIFDGRYILVPEDGENLRSRKLPIAYFAEGQFWVNNHAHIIKAKPGVAVDRFVQSALEATHIGAWVTGAAQPKLTQANLKQIPLLIPSLSTQHAIAEVLDSLDGLIENNRRRMEVLEEMAGAIYREWFVKFRYPGHQDVPLVDSALGLVPKDWEVGRVDSLFLLQRGFDLPLNTRESGTVPVIGASGVLGSHSVAKARGPGVTTGRSGTVGVVTYVRGDFWPLNTSLWIKEFRLATPKYAFFLLAELDLKRAASGAAVPTLDRKVVHALPAVCPPTDLIARWDSAVAPMFETIDALRAQSDRATAIRDLLVPKLVTGQIDLSALDLGALVEDQVA